MKEIIAQYGTSLIASVIAGALILMMFTLHTLNRSGVGGGIGDIYEVSSSTFLTGSLKGTEAENYKKRAGITLTSKADYEVYAGKEFAVSDIVTATDAAGNEVKLRTIRITNESGEVFYGRDFGGVSYVSLAEPGIYTFWLVGEDQNGVLRRGAVNIPVQADPEVS